MRTISLLVLAAMTLAVFAPVAAQYQDVANTTATTTTTFDAGLSGWTITGADDTRWAWNNTGFLDVKNQSMGGSYDNNVDAIVTSPMFDFRNSRIEVATIDLKGSSDAEIGTDVLNIEARPMVGSPSATGDDRWITLGTYDETSELAGAFAAVNLLPALTSAGLIHDSQFQLRVQFDTDGSCDGRAPNDQSIDSSGVPDGNPPTINDADDDFDDCDGQGDHDGWAIDNLSFTARPYLRQNVVTLFEETFQTTNKLTVVADNDPTQTWTRIVESGNGALYAANATNGPSGYENNVVTTATTPVLQTDGYRLRSVSYEVHGSSWAADPLQVQWRLSDGPWKAAATHTGKGLQDLQADPHDPARDGMFHRVMLRDDQAFALLAEHPYINTFQLRFRFASDGLCDSAEYVAPPPAEGDPPRSPLAPPACGGGTHQGWWIDDIKIDAWTIPTTAPAGARVLPFAFPTTSESVTAVHAANDREAFIGFDLNRTAFDAQRANAGQAALPAFAAATARLTHSGGEVLTQSLQKATGDDGTVHWFGALAVSNPDLLLGGHSVAFRYTFANGTRGLATVGPLTVGGTDTQAPMLTTASGDILSENGFVRVEVSDAFLRSVTYQTADLTPQTLAYPYIVRASQLQEGNQTLTFVARDRAGLSTTLAHNVVKDTIAPDIELSAPDVAYQGIPNELTVHVTDDTATRVTLFMAGNVTAQSLPSSGVVVFDIPTDDLGDVTLSVTARDAAGNQQVNSTTLSVVALEADPSLVSFEVPGAPFLVGEEVSLQATVAQVDGLVDLPVNVTMDARRNSAEFTLTVPQNGTANVTWSTDQFAPGRQTVTATVHVPEGVIELDHSNNTQSIEIEVFLGRVDYGTESYYIRSSAGFGLPLEAVDVDTGSRYRLELPDPSDSRYWFDVDGESLFWNPLMPVTVNPLEVEEPSPGIGLFGILALLGIVARRRL